MKKLFITSILILILLGYIKPNKNFSLLDYFSGEYNVYTSSYVNPSTDLGFCYMSDERNDGSNVIGESIKIYNFEPISCLKVLNAELVKTEVLSDGKIVLYAYTNLITDKVVIDSNEVNLQIACAEDYCVVGWPLILGSF